MNARWSGLFIAGSAVLIMLSAAAAGEAQVLKFEKTRIGTVTYEACSVFDVNNDGMLDIVSGAYWYEGPDFKKSHKMCDVQAVDEYFDDFSDLPMDVNGDGYLDFITGGWWGNTLRWRENPSGDAKEWPEHVIAEIGNVETTRLGRRRRRAARDRAQHARRAARGLQAHRGRQRARAPASSTQYHHLRPARRATASASATSTATAAATSSCQRLAGGPRRTRCDERMDLPPRVRPRLRQRARCWWSTSTATA